MKVETAIEAANAAAIGSKTTLAGSATAGVGWATSSAFFGWVGVIIALLGLGVNYYFRCKEHELRLRDDARKEAEHLARMQAIQGGCDV
jgi:heme exporter protein D